MRDSVEARLKDGEIPLNERLSLGDRLKYSLLATLILFIILSLSSLIPISGKEAGTLLEEAKKIIGENPTILRIWMNNMTAALLIYIPFLGIGLAGYIMFQTGRVFGAIATESGINSIMLILFAVATIYGLIEFIAYGTALTESILFSYSIIKRSLRHELRWLLISIGIVAGLLLIAATLEVTLINFFTQTLLPET